MTAAYEEIPFSELLHRPAATADRLHKVRALRLRRRDAADLALMRVEQMEQDSTVVDFAANLLSGLVRLGNPTAVEQVLRDTLPWIRFLPDEDAKIFLRELTEVARGAAALDNLAPVAVLLTQWRHTAEVHADPALHALVTGEPQGDFGPAHIPEETD